MSGERERERAERGQRFKGGKWRYRRAQRRKAGKKMAKRVSRGALAGICGECHAARAFNVQFFGLGPIQLLSVGFVCQRY